MFHGQGFMGWFWMLINFGFWLLVIGGIILLVVLAFRRSGGGSYSPPSNEPRTPKEVAQMRYARGEITREEYNRLLDDLNR